MSIFRDPETEKFIMSLKEHEKYFFMRDEFDRITNNGVDYNPDHHDEQVFKTAGLKFNISLAKADDIYKKVEIAIADFHDKRLKNSK